MPKKTKSKTHKALLNPTRNEMQLLYWGLQELTLSDANQNFGFIKERLTKRLVKLGARPDPQPRPAVPKFGSSVGPNLSSSRGYPACDGNDPD